MSKQAKDSLVFCIIASGDIPINEANLQNAKGLCQQVILIASARNASAKSISAKMKIQLITIDAIDDYATVTEKITSDWIFCIKANELIKCKSPNTLTSFIKDQKQTSYGIYVREYISKSEYDDFTFIRNLGQYGNTNEEAGPIKIESRLVRKQFLIEILKSLIENKDITLPFAKTIHNVQLTPDAWQQQEKPATQDEKNHDLLCLKGDLFFDSVRADHIDELNPGYIGFKVVNMGYIDGYLEIAERGWGSDIMYIPMFQFLIQNGKFSDAKAIYDLWRNNRYGEENDLVNSIGGCIYANLFLFQEALAYYEKAIKYLPDSAFLETLGRLHLILGYRDKAINYLNQALAISPNNLTKEVLNIINNHNWRPLKLSACIIARDEEKTISESIISLKNIADEIIVVDTGSQDSTIKISQELGCKIVSISWNDDFSEARNRAIEEATGDYILMLDADEYIDDRDRLGLLMTKCLLSPDLDMAYRIEFKDKENSQSFSVALLNTFLNKETFEFQIRIFPRLPNVRYSGFVFESLEDSLEQITTTTIPFFKITKQNIDMISRNERKLTAVRKEMTILKRSYAALDCMLYFLRLTKWSEALECFRNTKNIEPVLATNIVNYYISQNKLDDAKIIATKALADNSDSFALNMALAIVYFREENYAAIYNTLIPFLKDDIPVVERGDYFYYLGIASLEKNLNADAIEYIARALEINPVETRYQIAGLYTFAKSDNWEQFMDAAGKIVNQEKINIDFEIKDFSDLGQIIFKFIQYFSLNNKNEETALLRKIIAHMIFAKFINIEEIDHFAQIVNGPSTIQQIY